jgi:hypothetical protein
MTFTVRDISGRYAVSVHTVLAWIANGQLRAVNVSRRLGAKKPRWRVTQQALEQFEFTRTATPPPPRARRKKQPADVIEFYTKA